MTDAPERIWAVTEPDDVSADILGGVYAQQTPDGMVGRPVEYRRADLPPTLAEALALPEVRALVDAAMWAVPFIDPPCYDPGPNQLESALFALDAAQADYEQRILSALESM